MTSVIIKPCGPGEPMERYNDTIAKPVVFSDHAAVIPAADLARLNELFPDGRAPMWGGARQAERQRWQIPEGPDR